MSWWFMYVLTRAYVSCSWVNRAWVRDFETAEACCDPKPIIISITLTKTRKWMSKVRWCVLPLSFDGTGGPNAAISKPSSERTTSSMGASGLAIAGRMFARIAVLRVVGAVWAPRSM